MTAFKKLKRLLQFRLRLRFDFNLKLGEHRAVSPEVDTSINKEDASREFVFSHEGSGLRFLDIGARDGELYYLLGVTKNLNFDESFYDTNKKLFAAKYEYWGLDLEPTDTSKVISADICSKDFRDLAAEFKESFDVVYSNNVFEHLDDPFTAAHNISYLLKQGGIVITIVPFAQRYHRSPDDYFRFTHRGVEILFTSIGNFRTLKSGYDIHGRRNNWQGSRLRGDQVPKDSFGAWRETWFTFCAMQKL